MNTILTAVLWLGGALAFGALLLVAPAFALSALLRRIRRAPARRPPSRRPASAAIIVSASDDGGRPSHARSLRDQSLSIR